MVSQRVINVIGELAVMNDCIKIEDDLRELGFDSLKMAEVIIAIEDEFDICFEDSALNPKFFKTVNDLIKLVETYD